MPVVMNAGQVIRRDEADDKYDTGDPHEIWYRHGGREIGYVGNNGSASDSYAESIRRRASKPEDTSTFAPLGSQPRGSHLAETIDRINSFETGSAGRSYTVQAGDTLSGIADQIWGDASLWYKLATANGLGADSVLVAGQVLTIPAGVVRSTYNADTYKPYDPTDVLGDINPNPKAKRGNKCGGFGKILLVAVAVAATIFTSGAAIAALSGSVGSVMQGVGTLLALKGSAAVGVSTLIAAGVVGGAVGSAVSQGVGLALGIQDKFNWAGVAMAGLSGGVGAGLAAAPLGSGVLGATTRGLLGNVITQGVAMATDQQKRFDWVGLGVAGVSAAVGQGIAGNSKSFWVQTGAGAASSLAGAATRSILTETSFGDNILAVLPDVIGSTVGRVTARGVALASLSPDSSVRGMMGPYTGLQELISRYPGGGELVNASYQTPASPVAEEPDIVVIGRRLADEAAEAGRGILDRIDRFLDTNLFGHNPHKPRERQRDASTTFQQSYLTNGAAYDAMGQPLEGRSNYDAYAKLGSILTNSPNVSLGITLKRLGEWGSYTVPDATKRNAEIWDPYRGLNAEARAFALQSDRLTSGTVSGIATGISIQAGASPMMQDYVHGIASSIDGLLMSAGGLAGARLPGYGNQVQLDIINGENGIHGNSRLSARTTYLYELQTSDGEFLKYGISVNPATRYSKTFMADKDIYPIASGSRADMLTLERQMIGARPGPLNKERWLPK